MSNTGAVLVARCENFHEPDGPLCAGELRFRWGMSQAACGTCGAWCGVAVAAWTRVETAPEGEDTAWSPDDNAHAARAACEAYDAAPAPAGPAQAGSVAPPLWWSPTGGLILRRPLGSLSALIEGTDGVRGMVDADVLDDAEPLTPAARRAAPAGPQAEGAGETAEARTVPIPADLRTVRERVIHVVAYQQACTRSDRYSAVTIANALDAAGLLADDEPAPAGPQAEGAGETYAHDVAEGRVQPPRAVRSFVESISRSQAEGAGETAGDEGSSS